MLTFVLLLVGIVLSARADSTFPCRDVSPKDLGQCSCFDGDDQEAFPLLACQNVTSSTSLEDSLAAIHKSRQVLKRIEIIDSVLTFLPEDIFKNNHVTHFYIKSTLLPGLDSTKSTIFRGAENSLTSIAIIGDPYVPGWDMTNFKPLKVLKEITFNYCGLNFIWDNLVENLSNTTTYVNFGGNNIEEIDQGFFLKSRIEFYEFSDNKIRELPENTFPDFTKYLYFRRNKISTIPPRFFRGLEELRVLDLEGNLVVSLDPRTFRPLNLDYDLFQHLIIDLNNNPIVCCSKLSWLPDMKIKSTLRGICTEKQPYAELKDLTNGYFKECDKKY